MGAKPSSVSKSAKSRWLDVVHTEQLAGAEGSEESLNSNQVPYDILSAILFQCIPDFDVIDGMTGLAIMDKHPIVLASHVCRYWRSVVLSTPGLWATIPIRIPKFILNQPNRPFWPDQIRKLLEVIRVWVARSGDHPLSIHIAYFTSISFGQQGKQLEGALKKEVPRCLNELVDELSRSSRRWRNLTMAFRVDHHTAPLLRLFDLAPQDLPLLERSNLEVFTHGFSRDVEMADLYGETYIARVMQRGFFTAPRMRSLSLNGEWGRNISSPAVCGGWTALTELEIRNVGGFGFVRAQDTHTQAVRLLRAFPSLVCCSFQLSDQRSPILHSGEPIALRNLTTLKLDCFPVASGFAACFLFPVLSRLSLTYNPLIKHKSPWTIQGSIELLRRVGGQLTVLQVPSLSALLGDQSMQLVHNLTTLRVGLDVQTIKDLTPTGADTGESSSTLVPCPKLREFDANLYTTGIMYYDPGPSEDAVVDMLAARRQALQAAGHVGGASIRRLRLTLMATTRRKGFIRLLVEAGVYPGGLEVYFYPGNSVRKFWYEE